MRLVVRCIYYMPVTPSCDVIELDHETWIKFLHSESMIYRINMVLKHLNREYMSGKVRELAWIPLDDNMEFIKHDITKTTEDSTKPIEEQPEKKVIITKEQIEQYKSELRKELASMTENGKPVFTKRELENEMGAVSNREIRTAIGDKMSPKDYADFISQ